LPGDASEKIGAGAVFADFSLASRAGCEIIAGKLECSFTNHLLSFDMKKGVRNETGSHILNAKEDGET
jgi:hypothetical protein